MIKRKRLLVFLSALTAILLISVTIAFFQDTEQSKNNTFQAGSIDIKLANTSYYNGETVEDSSWTWSDLDDGNGSFQGEYLFYNFNDLKPGDWGENTLGLKVIDNDSWLCADVTLAENNENTIMGPERRLQDTEPVGELANELNFIWWLDDGDNVYEDDETLIQQVVLGDAPLGIPVPVILADSTFNRWNAQGGPFPGDTEKSIGTGWCYGEMVLAPRPQGDNSPLGPVENSGFTCSGEKVGDISQSDSAKLDLLFYAVQSRHNDSYVCPSLKYPLSVTKSGNGAGTVLGDVDGIDCGDDCSEDYYRTTEVTLTPNPDINSNFTGWSGDCSGTGTCVLGIDSARNVTAEFSLQDSDNDGVSDGLDNCPDIPNPDQADSNQNGVGDACDIQTDEEICEDYIDNDGDQLVDENCELFFSEYVEGASSNKALEIYNPSNRGILLSDYEVAVYTNGSVTPTLHITFPSIEISPQSVYVVCSTSFQEPERTGSCHYLSGSMTFNGNDAVVLKKWHSIILDVIGIIGNDPLSQWGAGLASTQDNSIVRKCEVNIGSPNGFIANPFDITNEWEGYELNNFSHLGWHCIN